MRSAARLMLVAVLALAGPVLSACESFDNLTEMWDSKKKLTGDRKPVFPEGVPGVSTGVPAELVKGYREPEGGLTDPAKAAAEAAADSKQKPQRTASNSKPAKPKKKKSDDDSSAQQQPPAQAVSAPWPSQQQQQQQQQQSPWPGSR